MELTLQRAGLANTANPIQAAGVKFGAAFPTGFSMVQDGELWEQKADVLLVPVTEQTSLPPGLTELNRRTTHALSQAATSQNFLGQAGKTLFLRKHPRDRIAANNVVLVGVGPSNKLTPQKLENAVAKALQHGELSNAKSAVLVLPENNPQMMTRYAVEALVGGVNKATYRSRQAHKPALDIAQAGIFLPPHERTDGKMRVQNNEWTKVHVPSFRFKLGEHALTRAKAVEAGISYAKDIANMPYNLMRTSDLVNEVQEFAAKYPTLKAEVKDGDWVKRNMPSFYSVGAGSARVDAPRFIKVTYTPPAGPIKRKVAVVGKTIMYDTGGNQSKGDAMNNMSKDKSGGAYALGLLKALAELQLKNVQVTVYLPATPNMPGPEANLPDNILLSTSGKRVKVEHTDAEGRLALIDAVAMAARGDETGKPDEIITLATLTGAAMRAVGNHVALITHPEDYKVRNAILNVARSQGEHFDTLPVCEDDFAAIKDPSDAADIRNSNAGAERGAQKGGAFVMNGLPEGSEIPLSHWDIAGVMGSGPGWQGPATAKGLKTLIRYVVEQSYGY